MLAGISRASFIKVSQSYVYVKIALLFFLLIAHGCDALAFWAALHTIMCLDITHGFSLRLLLAMGSYVVNFCVFPDW